MTFLKSATTLLFIVLFFSDPVFSQGCPPNFDFELGDFSHWQCFVGETEAKDTTNYINLVTSSPMANRHEIISDTSFAKDQYGGFPVVCPYGGRYSVKLGNNETGRGAEGISYTFVVPSQEDTFTITYFYAVVFQDPGHFHYEQPRFFVTAYDVQSGELIDCASYNYIATSSLPGFKVSKVSNDVLYKDWSPVSIQFIHKANREVRLEFKTADCTKGGHFGYAYLDVGTGCSNLLATAPYCVETNSLILNAPYGFDTYTWWDEKYKKIIGYGQALTLSPPPSTQGTFHVDLVPFPGFGCRDTASAFVQPLPVPDTPVAPSRIVFCQNDRAPELKATVTRGNELLWYTKEIGGTFSYDAPLVPTAKADTLFYYCSQKVMFGCESPRKKIMVIITKSPVPSFTVNANRQCENVNQFVFTNTSTNLSNSSFYWDFGESQSPGDSAKNTTHSFKTYGNYYVKLKVINDSGCIKDVSQMVTLVPKPVADFRFPSPICENQTGVSLIDNSTVPNNLGTISYWSWKIDTVISHLRNPAPFTVGVPGQVYANLVVATSEGCISDTNKKILNIRFKPKAAFDFGNTLFCNNEILKLNNSSYIPSSPATESIIKWYWEFDNNAWPGTSNPNPQIFLNNGNHDARLVVETNYGCKSEQSSKKFEVFPKPNIGLSINDSCVFKTIRYQAIDLSQSVAKWYWNFNNRFVEGPSLLTKYFNTEGNNDFVLMASTVHGCNDTLVRPFSIFDNKAHAGRDTLAAIDQPVLLISHGGPTNTYVWSPATGLDNPNIENPTATWHVDQLYTLDAITDKGCESHSKILVKRFKGPDIYIPTAFTPNGDRLNDMLKAFPVGIKAFISFEVYNRYGEKVFSSSDFNQGWDGKTKGVYAISGNYVAVAKAIDYRDQMMTKSVNVILIR